MIDYEKWAEEYRDQIKTIDQTIEKYKNLLEASTVVNRERLNKMIFYYQNLKYDLLRTSRILSKRGEEKRPDYKPPEPENTTESET